MWAKSSFPSDPPKQKLFFQTQSQQQRMTKNFAETRHYRDIPILDFTPLSKAHLSSPKGSSKQLHSNYGVYSERKRYSDYVTSSKVPVGKDMTSLVDVTKSQRSSYRPTQSKLPKELVNQYLKEYDKSTSPYGRISSPRVYNFSNQLISNLSSKSSNSMKPSIQHIEDYKQLLSPRQPKKNNNDIPVMMKSFSNRDSSWTAASYRSEQAKENYMDIFKPTQYPTSPKGEDQYFKRQPVKEKRCYNTPRDKGGHQDEDPKQLQSQLSSKNLLYPRHLIKHKTEDAIKTKTTFSKYSKEKITPALDISLARQLYFSGVLSTSSIINLQINLSINDFEMGKCRGDGKFGRVLMCRHRQTGTLYAVKEIPKTSIKKNSLQKQLIWQIKIQTFFDHANIVKLYGCFSDVTNIYLLMEYMQGGTLFDQLKKQKGGVGLPEQEVCKRMRQVCSAVYYMHDLQVAHRDIKPQNIVLSNVPNDLIQGIAKLCDFGWSTLIHERRSTYCGTFDYSSPEMLEGKQYDQSIDLWSLGVLAYELLTGKLPFYSISRKQTINNITSVRYSITQVDQKNITFPSWMSLQACSFIEGLLKKEPDQRREAEMLLSHPFLKKYKDRLY